MNDNRPAEERCDTISLLAVCEKLLGEGRYHEALKAARVMTAHPAVGSVACDLHGQAAYRMGHFAEAACAFSRAIGYNPGQAPLWANLALTQASLGYLQAAMRSYDRGLALEPKSAHIRFNQATTQLALGRWDEGLNGLRARHSFLEPPSEAIAALPEWDGVNPATVLAYGEQGFGDQILFARYLEPLDNKLKKITGCHLTFACSSSLIPLFQGKITVGSLEEPPPAEARIPLMDLPALLDLGPLSERIPYLPYKSHKKPRARSERCCPHIGIAWAGSTKNSLNVRRSIPFKYLAPLTARKDICLVNLQHCEHSDDWPWPESMVNRAAELTDFGATARILGELDLVISVDTALAHLAGALGYPLWVLLAQPADWRWASDDQKTKKGFWYPKAHLFRQPQPGDWEAVVAEVSNKLDEVLVNGLISGRS